MSMDQNRQTPRRRRADRHAPRTEAQKPQAPLRAGYPKEEEAPLPLYGFDAAQPTAPQPGAPRQRVAPRVYEEANYQDQGTRDPRGMDDNAYLEEDYLPPRRWPWVLLSLLLVVVILFAASYFFIPKNATGILAKARNISTSTVDGALNLLGLAKKEPPTLIKFETPETQVMPGVKTVFTFTADQGLDDVRILDEIGNEVQGVKQIMDQETRTTWTLEAILDQPRTTTLTAGILKDKAWYQTDKRITLTVAEPTPVPTPVPTLVPTPVPTPVPVPTDAPTSPPTTPPTLAPVETQVPQPAPTQPSLSLLLPAFSPAPSQESATTAGQTGLSALIAGNTEAPISQQALDAGGMAEDLPQDELETPEGEPLEDLPEDQPEDLTQTADNEPADPSALEEAPQDAPQPTQAPAMAAATPEPLPAFSVAAADSAAPSKFKLTEGVYQGARAQKDFSQKTAINLMGEGPYTFYEGGVFTFRGDNLRQNAAFGTAQMPLDQMSVLWKTPLGALRTSDSGTLYGLGWTGQPAIIKWSVEVRDMMNLNEDKKTVKALKEVIVAAQDGKVYFVDLNDGLATRDPINVGFPLKGSVSVDAMGRPVIAFGQGISKLPNRTGEIGYHLYNLIDQSKLHFINGRKTKNQVQYASNGAFDGTALFDRTSDTMIVAGENGLLYTVAMNTVFDFKEKMTITVDPQVTYQRSKVNQPDNSVAIESSVAMAGPYAYVADKQGIIRCVDTNTLKTLWVFDTGDNTDATIALEPEGEGLSLYTGTTLFDRSRKGGVTVLRKINALTGEEIWKQEVKTKYDKGERAGLKASPLVGQGEIGDLVIFTLNMTEQGGAVLALNKANGETAWQMPLSEGAVSSPVAAYSPEGKARVFQADLKGQLFELDGKTGQILFTLDLGGAVEGSPAIYNDVLVIGTASRDNNFLYGIRLE